MFVHFYLGEAAQLTYSSFFFEDVQEGSKKEDCVCFKDDLFFDGLKNGQQ